jgi:hypothetical protein
MRWDDEQYIRFYRRNTAEWLALSWQARGLFGLLMREVDRAGILKVGKIGLKGVAVVLQAPWVEVETPLRELLADGCLTYQEEQAALFIPNFMPAQEATQNDAARKRKSREVACALMGVRSGAAAEKARASVTNCDDKGSQNVTESHELSQPVTAGHDESRGVTAGHSEPSLPSEPSEQSLKNKREQRAYARVERPWLTQRWGELGTRVLMPERSTLEEAAKLLDAYGERTGITDPEAMKGLVERAVGGLVALMKSWSFDAAATPAMFVAKWDDVQGVLGGVVPGKRELAPARARADPKRGQLPVVKVPSMAKEGQP